MKENLLNISDQEWIQAEEFFKKKENKNKTKLEKKKGSPDEHSFIKIPIPGKPGEYEIFAMSSKSVVGLSGKKEEEKYATLGEGAFGKVKVVQNRKGENFAVKIEGQGLRGENHVETQITQLLGFTLGEAERTLTNSLGQMIQKMFKGEMRSKKLYTVMQLREGEELEKHIYLPNPIDPKQRGARRSDQLSTTQKLITALKVCKVVNELHELGIIHADLKPANLMANIDGQQIVVSSIDFGLSMRLEPGANEIVTDKKGTPYYMAPELKPDVDKSGKFIDTSPVSYSFASDIYALGVTFAEDMGLKGMEGMLTESPKDRDNMNTVMSKLIAKLEEVAKNDPNALEPDTQKFISQIKTEINEKRDVNEDLNKIFNLYKQDGIIQQLYHSHSPSGTIGNWMISKAKSVSHLLGNKGTERVVQMERLATVFQGLSANPKNLTVEQRAGEAIAHIYQIRKEIRDETNLFNSSLEKVCNKLITEVAATVGQQKVEDWIKRLDQVHNPQQAPSTRPKA